MQRASLAVIVRDAASMNRRGRHEHAAKPRRKSQSAELRLRTSSIARSEGCLLGRLSLERTLRRTRFDDDTLQFSQKH